MTRTELGQLIVNGENSAIEFKRDDVRPDKLASEMVALLNLEGGRILLGVEDDLTVKGLVRQATKAEEWVMQIARDKVQPPIIPFWETVRWDEEVVVGVISLPADAPDKPYKVKQGSIWVTKVRVGTTTRDATREEEQRLYQRSGLLRYGQKPVPGLDISALDFRRLRDYFDRILGLDSPGIHDRSGWEQLLINSELAIHTAGRISPTIDGMLLFGRNPRPTLPQSGIRALCYKGKEPDYAAQADEKLWGAMVPLGSDHDRITERGLVDKAWDFIRRHTYRSALLNGARRLDKWDYPEEVVREALVNAIVHRDYSITGTDVEISVYSDRLEIVSPGRLPNTVTPDKMRSGFRYARNQTLVQVMRDYGYVENRGMGVRRKIIPGMLDHNGTAPDLVEEDERFILRLWKEIQ